MIGRTKININNKSSYLQTIILDKNGFIKDSCDSLFDSSVFKDKSIGNYFYFLASELPSIIASEANKITYNQMQTTQACLPGFYDFVFSKILIEEQEHILWEIYDYTNVYQEYVKVQQIKNEIDIHEQFLSRQKDLSSDENKTYPGNFFQSEYLIKQKQEKNNLVYQLIHHSPDSSGLSTNQRNIGLQNLLKLKGHLKLMIKEINKFLDHVKTDDHGDIDMIKLVDDLVAKESITDKLTIIYEDAFPSKVKIGKNVLSQIISLICFYEFNQRKNVSASLSFDFQKEENEEISTLYINYIEQLPLESDLNDDSTKRVIKLTILKSLVTTLGGSLMSKYSSDNHIFGALISLPLENR